MRRPTNDVLAICLAADAMFWLIVAGHAVWLMMSPPAEIATGLANSEIGAQMIQESHMKVVVEALFFVVLNALVWNGSWIGLLLRAALGVPALLQGILGVAVRPAPLMYGMTVLSTLIVVLCAFSLFVETAGLLTNDPRNQATA